MNTTAAVVAMAQVIAGVAGLRFAGLQACQGTMQLMNECHNFGNKFGLAVAMVNDAVSDLAEAGIACDIEGGGGHDSYYFEATWGVYNELQCGFYAFMDAAYLWTPDQTGQWIDQCEVEPALLTRAAVFTDEMAQPATIGEAQHAVAAGLIARTDVQPLGDVIIGRHPRRTSAGQITLFHGAGVGLQDLAVVAIAVVRAQQWRLTTKVVV